MNKILPSLMPKNQQELDHDLKKLRGIAKTLHLDVVDGKFAKNKTFQFPFRLSRNFNYNAHLMIKNPEPWIKKNLKKIQLFLPHFEEIKDHEKYIVWIKKQKHKVGFAIKPETKIKQLQPFLNQIDFLLILTVHPGFYGSKFLPVQLKKITQAKDINPKIKIIIDGGMNPQTIKKAKAADYFVSGSYTTKAEHPRRSIQNLKKALN